MSVWAKAWAYEQRCGKVRAEGRYAGKYKGNPTAKAVLVAVAEFADERGRCWAGQDTIAAMGDMEERTVREQLAHLEDDLALIRREPRRRSDGTRTSDMIYLLPPADRLKPPRAQQPENLAGGHASTGKLRSDNRKTTADQPAQFSPHEPSERTVIEPSEENDPSSYDSGSADEPPTEKVKPQDLKQFAVAELMKRVSSARERGSPIHDPLDRDRAQYARFFAARSKAHDVDTLLYAFDYMVAKASGKLEGEPKAWCGFDTALDAVLAGWTPAATAGSGGYVETEEQRRLREENEREATRLLAEVEAEKREGGGQRGAPSPDEIRRLFRETMAELGGRRM